MLWSDKLSNFTAHSRFTVLSEVYFSARSGFPAVNSEVLSRHTHVLQWSMTFISEKEEYCFTRWILCEVQKVLQRLSHFTQAVKLVIFIAKVLCSNHGRDTDSSEFSVFPWTIARVGRPNYAIGRSLSHTLDWLFLNYSTIRLDIVWATDGPFQWTIKKIHDVLVILFTHIFKRLLPQIFGIFKLVRIGFSITHVCQSQWPRGLRRGSAAVRLLGFWARIPPRAWMSVSWECFVLSGRGLYDGPIPRPEDSHWVWCAWVWL
jgi:hypothetical protein